MSWSVFIAFSITVLISVVVYFAKILIRRRRIKYHLSKIPSPPSLPIIGHTLTYITSPENMWKLTRQFNEEYYPIFTTSISKHLVVNIRHPDDAEVMLSSQQNITKSVVYDFLSPWFGRGLLTSTGQKWRHRRKILTPAFHFNILQGFSKIFDNESRRMVADIKSEKSETIDLGAFVPKYTLNAICETAMGTSLATMESENNDFHSVYRKSVHDLGYSILLRLRRPWLQSDFIFHNTSAGRYYKKCIEIVRGFSKKVIGDRKKYHEELRSAADSEQTKASDQSNEDQFYKSSKKKLAMLDLLIEAMKSQNIDDDGIWEEVDTFMFEGHDTTGMGICFTLLLLAEHRDIQQKAREEVDEVLNKSENGQFTILDLQQLHYLERCIKEGLRLYPSVPFISRFITEDMQLKKYLVPAGVNLDLHIYDLHRDPNFWPDPLKYDPDRFLPENVHGRHPFSYIPFSGGPRNCIGQKFAMLELKAIIGHLLHNFNMEVVDKAASIPIMPDLVLRPATPARVKFFPRAKK